MEELNLLLEQCLVHATHIRGLSPAYVASVRRTCKQFMSDSKAKSLKDCTSGAIEAWLMDGSVKRNWAPATFRTEHRNIGFLFRYLVKRGKIAENPTVNIELPKLPHQLPKALSLEQAERLIATAKRLKYAYRFEASRNAALIALMLFTGLRRQEVANLQMENVDLSKMAISVIA